MAFIKSNYISLETDTVHPSLEQVESPVSEDPHDENTHPVTAGSSSAHHPIGTERKRSSFIGAPFRRFVPHSSPLVPNEQRSSLIGSSLYAAMGNGLPVTLPPLDHDVNEGPWTPGGDPADKEQAQLLLDLAKHLATYGAPLYRVEHRFKQAAKSLDIPVTIFPLPRNLMITIGDGGSKHPSRALFLDIRPDFNMYKLHLMDKAARRLSKVNMSFEMIKMRALKRAHVRRMIAGPPKRMDSDAESIMSIHHEPQEVRDIIHDLRLVTLTEELYPKLLRLFANATCAACLCMLFQKGTAAEGVACFMLGGMVGGLQIIADRLSANEIVCIFISMLVSFLTRVFQHRALWGPLATTNHGLCHDSVAISSIFQYMPGIQFTLSMLELTDNHAVASAVRMFTAFIKALLVGYGLSFGSKFGVWTLEMFQALDAVDQVEACKKSGAFDVNELWRMGFFFPMMAAILVVLKSHYTQWPPMVMAGSFGYLLSTFGIIVLNNDMTAAVAAFAIGVVANAWARFFDEIAIATVLAGIIWLVPGSLGIRGAVAILNSDPSSSSSAFGFTIITRALSIAIGLLVANAVIFPMSPQAKHAEEDDVLAV